MTGEQARRAVDRFYRGNEDVEGFGLGLSIAQQTAEALDGELRLESDGAGTRARLLHHWPGRWLSPCSLVEDEVAIADAVAYALEGEGFEATGPGTARRRSRGRGTRSTS